MGHDSEGDLFTLDSIVLLCIESFSLYSVSVCIEYVLFCTDLHSRTNRKQKTETVTESGIGRLSSTTVL